MNDQSADNGKIYIIVNGRKREEAQRVLTFREVVTLAFDQVPTGENVMFTVTYRNGPPENPKGSLTIHDKVHISNGIVFNVTATDRS